MKGNEGMRFSFWLGKIGDSITSIACSSVYRLLQDII